LAKSDAGKSTILIPEV
jgi:hypothetical protein